MPQRGKVSIGDDVLLNFLVEKNVFKCPYCDSRLELNMYEEERYYSCETRGCEGYDYNLYSIKKDGILRKFNVKEFEWTPKLPDEDDGEDNE